MPVDEAGRYCFPWPLKASPSDQPKQVWVVRTRDGAWERERVIVSVPSDGRE